MHVNCLRKDSLNLSYYFHHAGYILKNKWSDQILCNNEDQKGSLSVNKISSDQN